MDDKKEENKEIDEWDLFIWREINKVGFRLGGNI